MSTQRISDDGSAESLAVLLLKLRGELSEIAGLMEAVEPVLESHANQADNVHAQDVQALQGLDLAIQKTHGLAEFLDHVASDMPSEWLIDLTTALNVLKLAELQNRLNPGSAHQSDLPRAKAVGDVDLF